MGREENYQLIKKPEQVLTDIGNSRSFLIINLNANDLNVLTERHRLTCWIKKTRSNYLLFPSYTTHGQISPKPKCKDQNSPVKQMKTIKQKI